MRFIGLGHQHQPARVLVEPVHNAKPLLTTTPGQMRTAMMNERIDESSRPMSDGGMNHQPRLFVKDEHDIILVNDIERNGFARRIGWNRNHRIGIHRHAITDPEAITRLGFGGNRLQMNEALFQQRLNLGARTLQHGGKKNIEALSDKRTHLFLAKRENG